jgi:ankyrin repeat protein
MSNQHYQFIDSCSNGNFNAVRDTLNLNPQFARETRGFSAAVSRGHIDIIKLFIQMFPNIYFSNKLVIHEAKDLNVIKYFVELYGPEILSILDKEGESLMHKSWNEEVIQYILEQYPEHVNLENKKGLTPLLIAAKNGHFHLFRLLLSKNAEICHIDADGNSVLSLTKHMGILKYAIKYAKSDMKCLLDVRNNKGETPLITAYKNKNLRKIKALLSIDDKQPITTNHNPNHNPNPDHDPEEDYYINPKK